MINEGNVGIQPARAIAENQIVSTTGTDIPEQPNQPQVAMPRQINVFNIIHQWQPMGFRVVVNLPFVGDDQNYLFAIRNGPFIPSRPIHGHYDIGPTSDASGLFTQEIYSFAYNNMVPVVLSNDAGTAYPDPSKPTISLTNYDMPPAIATFAQCFRRWRGDMQYRLRMVAGFATQGYVVATTLKNVFSPIGIYDQFKFAPSIQRQDISFRPSMQNSYAMADTSMFRHLELTMQYDYPTPYYDQFAWMAHRCVPGYYFNNSKAEGGITQRRIVNQFEPHGDNWIVVGIRGNLESSMAGSQIVFELEYRCAENFQFADPFFPPKTTSLPLSSIPKEERVYRVPDNLWKSDGVGKPEKIKVQLDSAASRIARGLTLNIGANANIGAMNNQDTGVRQKIVQPGELPVVDIAAGSSARANKPRRRVKRDGSGAEYIENISTDDDAGESESTTGLSMFDRLRLGSSSRNS
nr:putative capsid protein [buhirugu virus 17]